MEKKSQWSSSRRFIFVRRTAFVLDTHPFVATLSLPMLRAIGQIHLRDPANINVMQICNLNFFFRAPANIQSKQNFNWIVLTWFEEYRTSFILRCSTTWFTFQLSYSALENVLKPLPESFSNFCCAKKNIKMITQIFAKQFLHYLCTVFEWKNVFSYCLV